MQHVRSEDGVAKVLIFESNPERAVLITDRLRDHGIDAVFVDRADDILPSLRSRTAHLVLLNDCLTSTEELLDIAVQLRSEFAALPEIIFSSDNTQISLQDCHRVGCAHLLRRALDFTEICDLIERVAQVSGKRLYDGKQLRHSNRFGAMNGRASGHYGKVAQELHLTVNEVARGGFYHEFDDSQGQKFSEGMLIQFDLKLTMFPDYSFQGKGYVSWVRKLANGNIGVGIEFTMMPPESEILIKAFSDLFKIREFVPSPKISRSAA
ncbi:MAG: hypothetical protein ABIR96_08600 [Bdellovibrionota bacterium]